MTPDHNTPGVTTNPVARYGEDFMKTKPSDRCSRLKKPSLTEQRKYAKIWRYAKVRIPLPKVNYFLIPWKICFIFLFDKECLVKKGCFAHRGRLRHAKMSDLVDRFNLGSMRGPNLIGVSLAKAFACSQTDLTTGVFHQHRKADCIACGHVEAILWRSAKAGYVAGLGAPLSN